MNRGHFNFSYESLVIFDNLGELLLKTGLLYYTSF